VAIAAAAAGVLMVALATDGTRPAAATTAPNFEMEVLGGACQPSSAADCDILSYSDFTIGVSLTKINLPDYRGFQVKLVSPDELPYLNRPGYDEIVWPDCDIDYDNTTISATTYQVGCNRIEANPPSTYLGAVAEVDYRCVAPSPTVYTITMPQGALGDSTYLVDSERHIIDPEGGPSKTLTLRCFGDAPSPTITLTASPTPTTTPLPAVTSTPTPTRTPVGKAGDANCDGRADAVDAALVLQLSAGLIDSLPCGRNGDLNGDGSANAIDAALILQYVAGLIPNL
jgi:hypothetical protein